MQKNIKDKKSYIYRYFNNKDKEIESFIKELDLNEIINEIKNQENIGLEELNFNGKEIKFSVTNSFEKNYDYNYYLKKHVKDYVLKNHLSEVINQFNLKNNINNNEILKILNKFEEQYLHDIINNKTENNLKLIESMKCIAEKEHTFRIYLSIKENFYTSKVHKEYSICINKVGTLEKPYYKYIISSKGESEIYNGEECGNNFTDLDEETIQLIDKIILNEKLNENLKPVTKEKVKKI